MDPNFTEEEPKFIIDAVKAFADSEHRALADGIHTKIDMLWNVLTSED
jgi:hypothetical protein